MPKGVEHPKGVEQHRLRVLIADDDPVSRHLLANTLAGWGYEVVVACDGTEAWRFFEARDFPIVILDWVMPGLDGLELVRRIRSSPRPGYVYTILLTAKSQKGEVIEGLGAGADDCLNKPFDRDELQARLHTAERILKLEQALVEQNRLLREHNEQMVQDLRMACEVQQALLPQGYPSFPGSVPPEQSGLRFFDRYRPDGAVGGDFFDVQALSNTKAGLFICDVMGHGVRAALGTAMVRALLEGVRGMSHDPGGMLTEINRELISILGKASIPLFLSALYLVIDIENGEVRYAIAGHPAPLLLRRTEGVVEALVPNTTTPGPPLGVRNHSGYTESQAMMRKGDLLALFTDGLYEAIGADHEPFGQARLAEAFARRMTLPAGRVFDGVLTEVLEYTAGNGFEDDVCLVGVELTVDPITGRTPTSKDNTSRDWSI